MRECPREAGLLPWWPGGLGKEHELQPWGPAAPRSCGSDHPTISFVLFLPNRDLNPCCLGSWRVFVFH